jgi:trk system potassium uptake protein TrkA
MKVIVVGAGQVGQSIAQELQHDHDVVVIEQSPARLESLEQFDVMALAGNGASSKVLQEANAAETDLVIACTDRDEVNIIACAASKHLKAAFTIARVHNPDYMETWERGQLGVDFMVCSELLTAEKIAQLIGVPAAHDIHTFADGKILMAELPIDEHSPFIEKPIRALELPANSMIASLIRKGKVIIPRGDDVIQAGDSMVSFGVPDAVQLLNRRASGRPVPQTVVIIGGGRIGFRLALRLEKQGLRPKMIEANPQRSQWLAEHLPNTQVFQSSGTDLDFLEQERIGQSEVGVSVMDTDEKNLLSALLLKNLGVKRVISGVTDTDFIKVFERVGVDVAVSARRVIADEIIRFTKRRVSGISVIEGERAEVVESTISTKSSLVGVCLRDSTLPKEAIIGAIVRRNKVIIPRGEDKLMAGDRVIVFSEKAYVPKVEQLL